MNKIEGRVYLEALYMIKTKQTLREIAKKFHVSKSTVHTDLKNKLKELDSTLYECTQKIIKKHLETRHIKGGEATKKKYLNFTK